MLDKIISGGQTGVDRGALDAARALGIPRGGYCPRGRKAEDGRIPAEYPLTEIVSARYAARTEKNVLVADGTLVLCRAAPKGGTGLTCTLARRHRKPLLVVSLGTPLPLEQIQDWIHRHGIRTLNVAGPRESEAPGIQQQAAQWLHTALASLASR